ncbi:MAG: hypothetical protein ACRD29_16490 [Acidimicrobiales bacterium]
MTQTRPPTAIADMISAQLDALGRWIEGRFVVVPDPSDEVVPATEYFDSDFLRAAVARAHTTPLHGDGVAAADDADVNLRIAVSRFTRHYPAAITAIALVGLANGVGIDLSAVRCRLIVRNNIPFLATIDVDESNVVRCAARPTDWLGEGPTVESLDELRAHVWQKLYGENIAPLYSLVRKVTRISEHVMWTNAAEWAAMVSDAADEYLGVDAAPPYVAERVALLEAESLPGVPGANPLRGLMEWVPVDAPDFPHGVQVRRYCCMTYLLPDRLGRLCQNCGFLPLEDRIALTRERHGVAMTAPQDGPAVRRSIELGLQKVAAKP